MQLYTLVNHRHRRRLAKINSAGQRALNLGFGLALVMVLLAVAALVGFSLAYASLTENLPPVQALPILLDAREGSLMHPTTLYDRTGQIIIHRVENPGILRRYLLIDPNQVESIAPQLVQAVISLYDPDFWRHPGIQWQKLMEDEPATLAERLVLDLLLENEPAGLRRTLRMRLLAVQVTHQYGRASVLEWYLNSASFGHLAYGAESAAQLFLGKSANQLNLAEAALLAAALEAPALNPVDATAAAVERQQIALDRLVAQGILNAEQREKYRELEYMPPALPAPSQWMRAFSSLVLENLYDRLGRNRVERGGLQVITSLDIDLQDQLICTLQVQLNRLQGIATSPLGTCQAARLLPTLPPGLPDLPSDLMGSAVVLDPATGQVLAYVGDATTTTENPFVSQHEPGTLLTPFLAVSAFASGFGPASLVWDIPADASQSKSTSLYRGPVRLRSALANDTLNPLQQILLQISPANVWRLAEPLGLVSLRRTQDPAQLLISGGDSTLLQLAQAYSVFSLQGSLVGTNTSSDSAPLSPVSVLSAEDQDGKRLIGATQPKSRAVLSPQLAYLVHHVLSDETARWPSLGHPNPLEIGRPAGAKTGQNGDGSQVWTAGYTPQRVAVVWLGLPSQPKTSSVLDRRAAAGIWHAIMQYASSGQPPTGWNQPPGISELDVCDPSGLLPTRACPSIVSEVFLQGNEPTGTDNLYKVFQINRETGRLATVFTPPELIEERTFLVVPPDALAWGRLAGLPVPPAEYDLIQPAKASPDVQINQPANFSAVRGRVEIRGNATGTDFASYRIQAGSGINPQSWVQIGQDDASPVRDGILATWETPAESGLYALRLQVIRQDQRVETAIIQVTVDNTPPRVRILTPYSGQRIQIGSTRFTLQADATDNIGIQRVEFWMDGLLAGERLASPYTLAWQPLPGSHTLIVKAYDQAGNLTETTPLYFWVD